MENMEEYKKKASYNLKLSDILSLGLKLAGDLYIIADAEKENNVELANLCVSGADAFATFNKQVAEYISKNAD